MVDQLVLMAQAAPRVDGMYWVMLAARILHVLSAIILVGGLFYLRAVVTPATDASDATSTDRMFGGRRATWAMIVGVTSLLLLATGLWNYLQYIMSYEKMASSYHMIAGMKMLTGIALFFLAAVIAGRSGAAEALRSRMRLWVNICLVLGIVTVMLGSVLRTYPRVEKVDTTTAPEIIAP